MGYQGKGGAGQAGGISQTECGCVTGGAQDEDAYVGIGSQPMPSPS